MVKFGIIACIVLVGLYIFNFGFISPFVVIGAISGNVDSMFYVADNYYNNGKYAKAFYWYEKAAEQGYVKAQNNLAQMYYQGLGIKKDIVLGCAWGYLSEDSDAVEFCDTNLSEKEKKKAKELMKTLIPN